MTATVSVPAAHAPPATLPTAKDVTMQAITDAGFLVPEELQAVPGSNVDKNKHHDQFAYLKRLTHVGAAFSRSVTRSP